MGTDGLKQIWITEKQHHELQLLKAELAHKSISVTIAYLLYELEKENGN